MTEEKIIGIDLGTSNSAACVYIDGKATIIPSAEGATQYGKAFPSYVAFTENGERLVGEPAKKQAVTNPKNTISAIKRHMGEDYSIEILGKKYTPQDISAMILQKIKKDAETFLGEEIKKAVITVPAYFDDNQRTATKDAGEIAGFEVERLVAEPTAASLAYGIGKQGEGDSNILVFDLGGGTLDVTIMEFGGGVFNVQSTSGDTHLGGTDMDNILMKFLSDEFKDNTGIDLLNDEQAERRLREAAERAKIELSGTIETEVNLPFIAIDTDGNPQNLITSINRSKLENLVKPVVNRCGESIDKALSDANLDSSEIDKVILVGGPTRMPIVQQFVEDYIGKPVERGIDPMECVAQGAAIQGEVITGGIEEIEGGEGIILIDVTPLSLGTVVVGGITSVIIERNTSIPIKQTQTYTTIEDNQTGIICDVVQGERKMADDNTKLGSFVLEGIPPARRGIPQIDVTFEIDANGILNVTAQEQSTGIQKSVRIESQNKMSQEEKERKIKEAEKYAREDEERKKLAELKNEADAQIYTAKRLLDSSTLDFDSKNRIESLISELRNAMVEDNPMSIKLKTNDLRNAVADAGSSVY